MEQVLYEKAVDLVSHNKKDAVIQKDQTSPFTYRFYGVKIHVAVKDSFIEATPSDILKILALLKPFHFKTKYLLKKVRRKNDSSGQVGEDFEVQHIPWDSPPCLEVSSSEIFDFKSPSTSKEIRRTNRNNTEFIDFMFELYSILSSVT